MIWYQSGISSYNKDVIFNDRQHAGQLLAQQLSIYQKENPLLLGLTRGGAVVVQTIAKELKLSFDVLVVKKIPSPTNQELAIGALAPDNVFYVDWKLANRLGVDEDFVKSQIRQLADQIKQKTLLYRKGRKPYAFQNRTVILVDDGVATGATIETAIIWLGKKHTKKIIVALPVAPLDLAVKIKFKVDEVIILQTPQDFSAVGQFYKDFREVTDKEVVELLASN